MRMPLASGKAILSIIKTTHPRMPVLIMSAYWTEEMKDDCALLGTTLFLDKPLDSSHLLDTLARAVLRPSMHCCEV
jgi:DNA-binding NtrC family response regulator